jgi:hypothetical protein
MDILTSAEIDSVISGSSLLGKYNEEINRESAYEILGGKLEKAKEAEQREKITRQREAGRTTSRRKEKSVWESTTTRQIGRTVARELTRGLLGVLGVKTTTRRSSRKTVFPW